MSIFVPAGGVPSPLGDVLRQAGAVFSSRGGRPMAINYGSAAGELAVCVSAVGLVDRSELSKLTIEAPPAALERLMDRLLHRVIAPGGALSAGGAWWCRAGRNEVLVLSEPQVGRRQRDRLRVQALDDVELTVRDRTPDWAAIELLGRTAGKVLTVLGAYGPSGDSRTVSPFTAGTVDGVDVVWLLESDRRAVALVARERAGTVWRAIEHAGHEFGISCVGADAANRFALLERTRRSQAC